MRQNLRALSVVLSVAVLVSAGCASSDSAKETKPARSGKAGPVAQPSTVKFSQFASIELKPFVLAPRHANHEGNQKSARVMDELLQRDLKNIFPNLKVLAAGEEFSKGNTRTLQIEPYIEDIRIISTGARVWVGAMAGGSDLKVKVTYRDSQTGAVIAEPQFGTGVSGWTDTWGSQGNKMRDQICKEIALYSAINK